MAQITANNTRQAPVRTYFAMGELLRILVDSEASGGHYVVTEAVTPPGGGVPLLHTHPANETFYVLEGEFAIYSQDEQGQKVATRARPGDRVHVPGSAPHGYQNVGDGPGRVLMIIDGSGRMDEFFAELGTPVTDEGDLPEMEGPPDMEAVLATCARYDIHFIEGGPQ